MKEALSSGEAKVTGPAEAELGFKLWSQVSGLQSLHSVFTAPAFPNIFPILP